MSHKPFTRFILFVIILLASFMHAGQAQAWSGCGGSYVVQWGDTMSSIAARCGTSVSALFAANPWTTGYLYAGQVLVIPGGDYCNCPQDGYYYPSTNTYTVQHGDTFAKIAQRYGISVNSLWAANPYIWDINRIYPGQVLYVPGSYSPSSPSYPSSDWFRVVPASDEELVQRSYGVVPPKTKNGSVKLINVANAEVYVSLQGSLKEGVEVINEYPVEGTMKVQVPVGWYTYVAWVGGNSYSGQFRLGGDTNRTITFYPNKVVVE